jgi:hypothetical protein
LPATSASNHRAMILLLLLLRPNHQEIDESDEDDRQQQAELARGPAAAAACACASEMKKLNKDSMSIQTLDVGGRGLAAARHYGTGPQWGGGTGVKPAAPSRLRVRRFREGPGLDRGAQPSMRSR